MSPTESGERRGSLKSNLLARLQDPVQLRIAVILVVFLVGYALIYTPLQEQIDATNRKLSRDRGLLEVAKDLEELQKQYRTFAERVPQQTDSKEWVQCLLQGIGQFPLKMSKLDCRDAKPIGPYKAVVLQIELEGSFGELNKFLEWLETNKLLLRADEIRFAPPRGGDANADNLTMFLTVLGMTG
jgi:Tfp pilus assembly protein PilO